MMNQDKYIVLNGHYHLSEKPLFNSQNRAFRYGDALFETIRCHQLKPLYFEDHYHRLIGGMSLLQIQVTSLPTRQQFEEMIASLITKNHIFGDCRLRLTVFRADGGLYTPETNKAQYLLETIPLSNSSYVLNKKGLLTSFFMDEKKAFSSLNPYKTGNSLFFVLAGLHKKRLMVDDVLIANANGYFIEGLASNLFWIKNEVCYTPLRSSGCVDGIMRKQIISILKEFNYAIEEVTGAREQDILEADELFLTNAIQGIQWIVGVDENRYICRKTKIIARLLNERTFS